ncbi:MAG TPA: response regulator [bacterium]|nr:response regulator [bacterium]
MHILIVDDDKKFCSTLKKILDKKGYEVTAVPDPLRVLHTAKNGDFDLMLIDHRMSPMTGLEVLENLRKEGIRTPAIMISAYVSRDTFFESRRLGIVNYINKPFSMQQLEELIENTARNMKKE